MSAHNPVGYHLWRWHGAAAVLGGLTRAAVVVQLKSGYWVMYAALLLLNDSRCPHQNFLCYPVYSTLATLQGAFLIISPGPPLSPLSCPHSLPHQLKEEAPKKREAPVVVAAPMAPAVAEPPAPRPAAVEAPAAPAAAAVRVEVPQSTVEPPKGLQVRSETPSAAAAAPAAPNSAVLIGGGIAVLGAVAAAAMNNNAGAEGQAAAAAPAAPAAASPPAVPEGETAAAAVGGAGESANPSSKAE